MTQCGQSLADLAVWRSWEHDDTSVFFRRWESKSHEICHESWYFAMFVFGKHVETTSYSHMGMDQYLYIPFLGEWTSIYQLLVFWCSPGVQGFDTLPYIPMVKLLPHEIIGEFRSDGILLCSPAGSPCSVVKRARPIDYPWLSYWHVKHRHVNLLTCETLSELINFRIYFRQVKNKKSAAWNSQNTSHGMMSSHGFRYKQFVDKAKDDSVPNI